MSRPLVYFGKHGHMYRTVQAICEKLAPTLKLESHESVTDGVAAARETGVALGGPIVLEHAHEFASKLDLSTRVFRSFAPAAVSKSTEDADLYAGVNFATLEMASASTIANPQDAGDLTLQHKHEVVARQAIADDLRAMADAAFPTILKLANSTAEARVTAVMDPGSRVAAQEAVIHHLKSLVDKHNTEHPDQLLDFTATITGTTVNNGVLFPNRLGCVVLPPSDASDAVRNALTSLTGGQTHAPFAWHGEDGFVLHHSGHYANEDSASAVGVLLALCNVLVKLHHPEAADKLFKAITSGPPSLTTAGADAADKIKALV